jgi:hypothetical protein
MEFRYLLETLAMYPWAASLFGIFILILIAVALQNLTNLAAALAPDFTICSNCGSCKPTEEEEDDDETAVGSGSEEN